MVDLPQAEPHSPPLKHLTSPFLGLCELQEDERVPPHTQGWVFFKYILFL